MSLPVQVPRRLPGTLFCGGIRFDSSLKQSTDKFSLTA
jgi:hypothetical protein